MTEIKKLAFIGAHSSAKTTTINRISAVFNHLDIPNLIIPEAIRKCPYPINKDSGVLAQLWVLDEQVRSEDEGYMNMYKYLNTFEEGNKPKFVVLLCDRSIWDVLAYARSLNQMNVISKQDLKMLEERVVTHSATRRYSKIFFCEPRPIYADGVRDPDEEWQKEIYEIFKAIIKEYHLDVIRI